MCIGHTEYKRRGREACLSFQFRQGARSSKFLSTFMDPFIGYCERTKYINSLVRTRSLIKFFIWAKSSRPKLDKGRCYLGSLLNTSLNVGNTTHFRYTCVHLRLYVCKFLKVSNVQCKA